MVRVISCEFVDRFSVHQDELINSQTSISTCIRGVALEVLIARSASAMRCILCATVPESILWSIDRYALCLNGGMRTSLKILAGPAPCVRRAFAKAIRRYVPAIK